MNIIHEIKKRIWPWTEINGLETYALGYKKSYLEMRGIGDRLALKCSDQAKKIRELEAQIAEINATHQAEIIKNQLATSSPIQH